MEHLREEWTDFLEYAKDFITEPFVMMDIGCSGGIDDILKNFDTKIVYYGFDPNINEIELLKSENKNPNIHYIESFVDCGNKTKKSLAVHQLSSFFETTSAAEGSRIIKDKIKSSHEDMVDNNLWTDLKLSKKTVKIPEFVKKNNLQYIDFIKSDIDGLDLSFLRAAEKIITPLDVLSIVAEVSFADNMNDEADITNLLKKYGFALNLLSTRSYSSKYLPDMHSINIAAQSISGRLTQGDALYIKDKSYFKELDPQKLLKLAIIMDLFNLTDIAAEIFNVYKKELESTGIDVKKSLDLMTRQRRFLGDINYDDFIKEFHKNHDSFYPESYSAKDLIRILGKEIIKLGMKDFYKILFYMKKCDSKKVKKSTFSRVKKALKFKSQ